MILATVRVGDYERFLEIFKTRGAEQRREHGSKGSRVYRDPEDANRLWLVFDWAPEAWDAFMADPDMPAIFADAGLKGRPQAAELLAEHSA